MYKRSTITPVYRCSRWVCRFEFDTPREIKEVDRNVFWNARNNFISKNREKIDETYQHYKQREHEKYLEMNDVVTICKRCHGALRYGKRICPICKKRYISFSFKMCYNCRLERDPAFKKREEARKKFEREGDSWEASMEREDIKMDDKIAEYFRWDFTALRKLFK